MEINLFEIEEKEEKKKEESVEIIYTKTSDDVIQLPEYNIVNINGIKITFNDDQKVIFNTKDKTLKIDKIEDENNTAYIVISAGSTDDGMDSCIICNTLYDVYDVIESYDLSYSQISVIKSSNNNYVDTDKLEEEEENMRIK